MQKGEGWRAGLLEELQRGKDDTQTDKGPAFLGTKWATWTFAPTWPCRKPDWGHAGDRGEGSE